MYNPAARPGTLENRGWMKSSRFMPVANKASNRNTPPSMCSRRGCTISVANAMPIAAISTSVISACNAVWLCEDSRKISTPYPM